jgi:catechol 2,3-dioxygenase-like lactoylglutathione lyase family enzyme
MSHNVAIVTANLERSLSFYRDLFQLKMLQRPPFASSGAWLDCGGLQLHLVLNPEGTFRGDQGVDNKDGHYALRTGDFEGFVSACGIRSSGTASMPFFGSGPIGQNS